MVAKEQSEQASEAKRTAEEQQAVEEQQTAAAKPAAEEQQDAAALTKAEWVAEAKRAARMEAEQKIWENQCDVIPEYPLTYYKLDRNNHFQVKTVESIARKYDTDCENIGCDGCLLVISPEILLQQSEDSTRKMIHFPDVPSTIPGTLGNLDFCKACAKSSDEYLQNQIDAEWTAAEEAAEAKRAAEDKRDADEWVMKVSCEKFAKNINLIRISCGETEIPENPLC